MGHGSGQSGFNYRGRAEDKGASTSSNFTVTIITLCGASGKLNDKGMQERVNCETALLDEYLHNFRSVFNDP